MFIISTISIETFHSIITLVWGVICLLMGICLILFNIPERETVKAYRISVRVLSINYITTAILVFCMVFGGLRNSHDDVFPFSILLISISQGLILTFSLMVLYAPKTFARENGIKNNLVPYLLFIVLYIILAVRYEDPICNSIPHFFSLLSHPTVFARFLLLLFNIYQAVYYGILVQRLYVHYTIRLEKYDIDTVQLKLEWAKENYFLALIMCSTVILSCLFKNIIIDCIFTILLCLHYFFFALMHMQYKRIFTSLDPAFAGGLFQGNSSDNVYDEENQKNIFNWQKARHYIINQKLYLQSGITVNKLSEFFHTNRTSFSSAVNKNEGQSFSMFINQLRMVEAKKILVENPEKTLSEIAQHCGYTEQSNFTRQFRQLCGETPAAWKEKNKKCGFENL